MVSTTKTALITGSSSGIGYSIANIFAQNGYQVILHGLEKNGEELAEQLAEKYGVSVFFSNANLMDPEQIQSLFKQAEERFGGVDILINNAGVQHVAPIDEFPINKWNLIIGVNLSAAFHTTQQAWPYMKKNKFGRIINIASAHGLRASAFKAAYVSAKHGIVGLTKVTALEGAPYNITCNAICPGYVKTPLVEAQIKDQAQAHNISETEVINRIMLKKHAVKDFVTEELIGGMCLFLCKEEANTLTGTAIPLDGGWTAQ